MVDQRVLETDLDQFPGNLLWWQDVINPASSNGTLWHLRVLRGVCILRERDPSFTLDRLQTYCTIGGRTREQDSYRLLLQFMRQGTEECINREMLTMVCGSREQMQRPLFQS